MEAFHEKSLENMKSLMKNGKTLIDGSLLKWMFVDFSFSEINFFFGTKSFHGFYVFQFAQTMRTNCGTVRRLILMIHVQNENWLIVYLNNKSS